MKKSIFSLAIIALCFLGQAQFTETNLPAVNSGQTMYVIDSAAVNYENVTGAGVTWDYSSYSGYSNNERNITVLDPANTPNASDFTSSTHAFSIEDATTEYFNSSSSAKTGQGYVFVEETFGEVKLVFDTDEATLMTFPMNVGDAQTDTYQGTLYFDFSGSAQSPAAAGSIATTVDAEGTLILAGGTYSNVLRYKLTDTATATLPLVGDVNVIRRQFEYYDLANSSLPLFSHLYINITQSSGSSLAEVNLVLSKDNPATFVSVDDITSENSAVNVYPNPADNNLTIKANGEFEYAITNTAGKIVFTNTKANDNASIDISELKAGVYFVNINTTESTEIKKIVVQ